MKYVYEKKLFDRLGITSANIFSSYGTENMCEEKIDTIDKKEKTQINPQYKIYIVTMEKIIVSQMFIIVILSFIILVLTMKL